MVRTVDVRAQPTPVEEALAGLVAHAVRDGIIAPEQAERMLSRVPDEPQDADVRGGRLGAHVAEALGYVGAALVLVAGVVVAQQVWVDMSPWAHASLLAVLAVVLLAAGAVVHGEPRTPLGRLGSFLWLLALGAVAGTASVVAEELLELQEAALGVAVTSPTTVIAALLWRLRMRTLQEVAVVAGLTATSVTLLALAAVPLDDWGGLLVWSIGVAWFVLAWAGVVRPVRTGQVAGAVVALLGPLVMVGAGRGGLVLGVVTAAALVAASVALRETALSGLGVLGLFVFIPQMVFEFFGDQLGAPVALLVSGGLLLGVALWLARAHGHESDTR